MEYRRFGETYVLRLDRGEEILSCLESFCRTENIKLGSVEGLGASDHVIIGLYDVAKRVYHKSTFDEPMEITSLVGNISTKDGEQNPRPFLFPFSLTRDRKQGRM